MTAGMRGTLSLRDGRLPGPIDPELGAKLWRWSRSRIEAYVDGLGS